MYVILLHAVAKSASQETQVGVGRRPIQVRRYGLLNQKRNGAVQRSPVVLLETLGRELVKSLDERRMETLLLSARRS